MEKIYEEFTKNVKRLLDQKALQAFATEYIFKELTQKQILSLIQEFPDNLTLKFNKEILTNQNVLIQAQKILTLMEISDTIQEFEKLHDKTEKKIKKPEPQGFDKILKGIMQVPKPPKEKK